jgi:hypothetical protein
MGARRSRRFDIAAFKAEHPRCCFCNGERPTDEPDHAPARICFRQKQGPEGFVFPSCVPCNRAASLSEQVVAFHIRMMDQTGAHLDEKDLDKLITGVVNNAPSTLPVLNRKAADRLRGLIPDSFPVSNDERVMQIDKSVHDYVELFGTKMLYAMRYRLSGKYAGPQLRRWVMWAQVGTPSAKFLTEQAERSFGKLQAGERANIKLGDQFHYRHGFNSAHGYLGLWMQFGQSLILHCVLGPGREMATLKNENIKRYQPIRELGININKAHRNRPWTIVH